MTLLIVDDDADQLYVRRLLLEKNGFRVLAAVDRPSAVAAACDQRVSCALVDLNLPTEKDGLALIRDLKALRPGLRILLLTGRTKKRLPSTPEMLLVDDIVEKGSNSSDLIRKLRSA